MTPLFVVLANFLLIAARQSQGHVETAKLKQFPFHVALLLNLDPKRNHTHWCGGSLISPEYVLTAAGCIRVWNEQLMENDEWNGDQEIDPYIIPSIKVYLGVTNINSQEAGEKIVRVTPESFILHKNHSKRFIENDIALIKLPEPVELNEYIQVIDLPKRGHKKDELLGKSLVSFGRTVYNQENKRTEDTLLKYYNLDVLPINACHRVKNETILDGTTSEDNMYTCEGYPKGNICLSENGSPHVLIEESGKHTLFAFTSIFLGCGKDVPQIQTRVSNYLEWIYHHTGIPIED